MSLLEALQSARASLGSHKLRTALTMLGMLFGVGAVIAMLSIGTGAEREAMSAIEALGIRNILIHGREARAPEIQEIRKRSIGLSLRDARAIQGAVPAVESVGPRIRLDVSTVFSSSGRAKPNAYGVGSDYAARAGLRLAEGRFFDEEEGASHAQVCVVGSAVRRELFGAGPAVGRDVKVEDVWLTVVGVLQPESSTERRLEGVRIESTARQVLIPLATAMRKFERSPVEDELDEIRVTLKRGADAVESAAVIDALLDRLHGGAADYDLTVPQALLEQSRKTQRLFSIVMGSIAGISLLVGGIGIMNIMLATVVERTLEIGVRRAVGARRSDIRNQFVVEAFAISLLGGGAGIVAGVGIARGVAAYARWATVITPWSVLLATGVSLAVGLVFGIYPAWRAATLDPVEALRHE